jgi:hypothetical protein
MSHLVNFECQVKEKSILKGKYHKYCLVNTYNKTSLVVYLKIYKNRLITRFDDPSTNGDLKIDQCLSESLPEDALQPVICL